MSTTQAAVVAAHNRAYRLRFASSRGGIAEATYVPTSDEELSQLEAALQKTFSADLGTVDVEIDERDRIVRLVSAPR